MAPQPSAAVYPTSDADTWLRSAIPGSHELLTSPLRGGSGNRDDFAAESSPVIDRNSSGFFAETSSVTMSTGEAQDGFTFLHSPPPLALLSMTSGSTLADSPSAAMQHGPGTQNGSERPRKKLGRPIAYTGDVNAQHLTEAERRRIRRRVANRESARRVRQRRQEMVNTSETHMQHMQAQIEALSAQLHQAEAGRKELQQQLAATQANWAAASEEYTRLKQQQLQQQHQHQQLPFDQAMEFFEATEAPPGPLPPPLLFPATTADPELLHLSNPLSMPSPPLMSAGSSSYHFASAAPGLLPWGAMTVDPTHANASVQVVPQHPWTSVGTGGAVASSQPPDSYPAAHIQGMRLRLPASRPALTITIADGEPLPPIHLPHSSSSAGHAGGVSPSWGVVTNGAANERVDAFAGLAHAHPLRSPLTHFD